MKLIDTALPCPTCGCQSGKDARLCERKHALPVDEIAWVRDAGQQYLLTYKSRILAIVTDAYEEVQLRVCIPDSPDWTFSFCKDDVDDPIAEAKHRCEMKLMDESISRLHQIKEVSQP